MRVVTGWALFTLALSGCSASLAPPAPVRVAAKEAPPPLVIALVVDQFGMNLLGAYENEFSGGFRRLVDEGVTFRQGYQAQSATETCPGHSTILTGYYPATSGMVANDWFEPSSARGRTKIYCAEDVTKGERKAYVASPVHLKVPTLGEMMKTRWPQSRSVAIAGKDRSAMMLGGQQPDARYYYFKGRFYSDLPDASHPVVDRVNEELTRITTQPYPAQPMPLSCRARIARVDAGGFIVGEGALEHGPSEKLSRATPDFDGHVLKIAEAMIEAEGLGADEVPDLLSLSLAATDYVGHTYGTEGPEMCTHVHALDRLLGDFLDRLDARGLDYALVLTADHGGTDIAERRKLTDPEARRVANLPDGRDIQAAMGLAVNPLLNEDDLYYFDPSLTPEQRAEVEARAVAAFRAHPDVEAIFTRAEVEAIAVPTGDPSRWTIGERVRATYHAARSGDLMLVLKEPVSATDEPEFDEIVTHGTVWAPDRRVPIIFWRPGLPAASPERAIATVDIMPTLAAMLDMAIPEGLDGRCLPEVAGATCSR